jgi:c-di-GMP-binding flagellar brake protein YcgR
VGAPIRIRVGWRQRSAILADLSEGGCRLLTHHDLQRGHGITVLLPAELTGGKHFSLRARVLRISTAEGESGRTVTARFEKISKRLHERLKAAIERHATGPAVFHAGPSSCGDETITVTGEIDSIAPAEEPAAVVCEAPDLQAADGADDPGADDPGADDERREAARRPVDSRVIALGQEATRVLMGRDISVGGMRVNPNPLLRLGDDFQLAIHVANADAPLIVKAKVHRDDAERGVVLRFHEMSSDATRVLNEFLDKMPLLDPGDGTDDTRLVVSQILDDGGAPRATA